MFVGSINQQTRRLLYTLRRDFEGKDIYVGCSGNFTVEGIYAGTAKLHSNDVSLYSYCIGQYASGKPLDFVVKKPELKWLEEYCKTPLERVTTITLCMEYLENYGSENIYFQRMAKEYEDSWEKLFALTKARLETVLTVKVEDYYNGDVVTFFASAPKEAVMIAFPPTYMGGYEKLYENIEDTFEWEKPSYEIRPPEEMFDALAEICKEHENWILMSDEEKEYPTFAKIRPDNKYKEVYLFGTVKGRYYMANPDKYELVPFKPIKDEDITSLKIVPLTMGQFRYLRTKYLAKKIVGSDFIIASVAVLNQDDLLVGFMGFNSMGNTLLMTLDASVQLVQKRYKKLSKLILLVSQTKEIQTYLRNITGSRVVRIQTTVFSKEPVSMKYRGLYELLRRDEKEGKLVYQTMAGQFDVKEALRIWKEKHEHIE